MKCHTCVGNDDDECNPTEVTCPGDNDKCATSSLYIDSFPCKVHKVFKGCVNSTTSTKKVSISPSDLITLSLQQDVCDSDLCNTQESSDPDTNQNDLYCHSCISPGVSCTSETMKQLRCTGAQNMCTDIRVIGSFGPIADVNMKGCGQIPSCTQDLVFSSQTSSVSAKCCNGNYCNGDTDFASEDKTPNGIQCNSCNTLGGASCSPKEVVKAQCYGALTSCLEIAGISLKGDHPIPTIIKGCATPSMCDSSLLPLLQKLGSPSVRCCNGSLCNNQFSESSLKASGYFPTGKASSGTGIKTKHSLSPVKTGHDAYNKYGSDSMPLSFSGSDCDNFNIFSAVNSPNTYPGNGNGEGIKGGSWNSNSNSGYPNPPFNSYNEFSNSGPIHDPSITTTQVNQGSSYNDLSIENPNSVYDSDIFSAGGLSTDNDGIFVDSESHTVSSPINYSSGEDNLNTVLSGGSAVGREGVSETPNYNSDQNSTPEVPPTFPVFPSYIDNNIVTNNNMNHSNDNDVNSNDSAGFTEVVYDWDEDQSNSPTVAPDAIVSNSYDSVGNSGSNNHNNETSGHSSDTMNIGSYVHTQGNNGSIQQTPNSYIKQQITGYGTNIHNTGNASENNLTSSGYNSSADVNSYDSAGFTEVVYDWDDGQSNFPTVVPDSTVSTSYDSVGNGDFSSYDSVGFTEVVYDWDEDQSSSPTVVPNNTVSNSYDSVDNNDFNSYDSAGFTEVVYDWDEDQSSSPTVAPDGIVPNSYDSVGNSGSNNSAYNPDTILLSKNNETSGHSSNTMNIGSYVHTQGNNCSIQHLTPATSIKTHNSGIKQHISGHGTNIYNTGFANNNGSGNYISSSGNNIAGSGNTSSAGTPGSSTHGGYANMPGGNGSSTTYTSLENGTGMTNRGDNSSNSSNYNIAVPVGYGNMPVGNHSSPTYGSPGNGTGMNGNDSNHYMAIPGHNTNTYIGGVVNNNGSGNYSSSSGINTAGSGNTSSTGTYGSSSHGGYANMPGGNGSSTTYTSSENGPGMTNGGHNSNNSSNYNVAVPLGYGNVPVGNHSSPTYGSSGNGTGMTNEWIKSNDSSHNMAIPGGYSNIPRNNHSSTSYTGNGAGMPNEWSNSNNSSSYNIAAPVGYGNVPVNNHSSPSYGSSGNGTGVINGGVNRNDSSHNMAIPGGYNNIPGSNHSSTSYTGYGAGMPNEWNNSNHSSNNNNIAVPVGYGNVPVGNHSSPSYGSSGNGTGVMNAGVNRNDSSHNMVMPGGYNNIPGSNHSSISYTGSGSGIPNSNHFNPNMSVPGAYANIPGSNGSSTSYASSGNGTGSINEWVNNNSSYHNMASPGGHYGSPNNNGNNYVSNSNYSSTFMMPNDGSNYGNSSGIDGSWDSIESYLNHLLSQENKNGSYSNPSLDGGFPGDYSNSNETTWGNGFYDPNRNPNNNNNNSSNNYNNIQNFLSTMNGYIHGNGTKNGSEWFQNNSFLSHLLPPGMNHNGSGPSGNNIHSMFNGSLSDYFKSLGASWNNSVNNITNMFSGGNFGSVWGNIMHNPNWMNPHNNGGSSYSNNQNPNPNSNPNSNPNYGASGSNGQPNSNSNGMSSGGYNGGAINGNGYNSYAVPQGGGSNGGSTDGNGNSYNTNLGHGLNGSMLGSDSNLHNMVPNMPNETIPGRSTNDSASGSGSGGGGGGGGGDTSNSRASSLWTTSGSLFILSAIALLVLN